MNPQAPTPPNPVFDPNRVPFEGAGEPKPLPLSPLEIASSISAPLIKEAARKPSPADTLLKLGQSEMLTGREAQEASRYTDGGNTYLRGRDNEAVAAAGQGFWSRTWNDTKALVGITGSSILQAPLAIPQLVKAGVSLLQGEGIDKALDYARGEEGSWMRGLSDWQDQLNQDTTNYSSSWARENPWKNLIPGYGGEGGTDFGSLVRSGGFVLSGIATSLAEGALGAALAPVTGGISLAAVGVDLTGKLVRGFKALSTIGKSLDKLDDALRLKREAEGVLHGVDTIQGLGKLWSGIDTPLGNLSTRSALHGFLLANSEASLEGYGAEKELERTLLDQYYQQTGQEATGEARSRIQSVAQQAGNSTYLWNHALLGVSNKFQIDSILKNFSATKQLFSGLEGDLYRAERKTGTNVFEAVRQGSKPLISSAPEGASWFSRGLGAGKAVGTQGLLSLSEGLEESLQKAVTDGTQSYYQYKYNHGGKADLQNGLDAATHGLSEAFGTSSGWTEFIGGMLIGSLFGGGSKALFDWRSAPGQQKRAEALAQQFNLSMPDFQRVIQQQLTGSLAGADLLTKGAETNAVLGASSVGAQAASQGQQRIFQNQKNSAEFSFLYPFVRQGADSVLKEQLDSFKQDIEKRPDEFRQAYGIDGSVPTDKLRGIIDHLGTKLESLQRAHDRYAPLFINPYKKDPSSEDYRDFEAYRAELLHNDYLRQSYGERIAKLQGKTSLLGETDWTSPAGWKARKGQISNRLTELDSLISLAKQSLAPTGDRTNPTDEEVARVDRQLRSQQRAEREELEARLSAIEQIQTGNFTDYDAVLDTIKAELTHPDMGTGLPKTITHTELAQLLQDRYDVGELQASIDKLTELFNGLSSRKGFEDYRVTTDRYRAKQVQKELEKLLSSRTALRDEIVGQFDSVADAELHLGSLDELTARYGSDYNQNPDSVRTELGQLITEKKAEKADEKARRDDEIRILSELVKGDPRVAAVQSRADQTGAELTKLIEAQTGKPGEDPLTLSQTIVRQYETKFPVTSETVSDTDWNQFVDTGKLPVGSTVVDKLIQKIKLGQPLDQRETSLYGEPAIAKQVEAALKQAAEKPKAPSLFDLGTASTEDDSEKVESIPKPVDKNTTSDLVTSAEAQPVKPIRSLFDLGTPGEVEDEANPVFDPIKHGLKLGITPIERERLNPEQLTVLDKAKTINPAIEELYTRLGRPAMKPGSLANKFNTTGMLLFDGKPIYADPDKLETDPVLRAEWEKVVNSRQNLIRAQSAGTPLSQLLDWSVLDRQQAGLSDEATTLSMDPGLQRSSVPYYLVGRDKQSGVGSLVIPLSESLRVNSFVLPMLLEQPGFSPAQLSQLRELGPENPLLTQVLSITGEPGYRFLQKARLVNAVESFGEYMAAAERFNRDTGQLTGLLDNGQVSPELVHQLDRLQLELAASKPFTDQGLVPVTEMGFGIDGKHLIVRKSRTESGVVEIKQVASTLDNDVTIDEEAFASWQPVIQQSLQNYQAARVNDLYDGYYYISSPSSSSNYVYGFRVVSPDGMAKLEQLIQRGESFSPQEQSFYLSIGQKEYRLEVRGDKLNEGKLSLQLQPADLDGKLSKTEKQQQTWYSPSIDVAGVRSGQKKLLDELNRVAGELKQKDGKATPIKPIISQVQLDEADRYKRMVQISSPAVFRRADLRWNLLQPAGDEIVLNLPVKPVVQTGMEQLPAVSGSSPENSFIHSSLQSLLDQGVSLDLLKAVSEWINENPTDIVNLSGMTFTVDDLLELDPTDEDQVAAVYNDMTSVQTGSWHPTPTTRLQQSPDNLDQIVDRLIKQCH
ncbi:hypothetical protein CLV58_109187 [Spirosoma oryzae]|uniref:Uncharacterized protein n=1 Tax=Spirosoma oryzae TaxID=1469603 RepID=A0A2T0SYG9_9BACT|nr:hypothetical protein [Spirosoma oryzae]PRY38460.1 hypothetical protein CLV58_109187 [Spirosoma oryzae]